MRRAPAEITREYGPFPDIDGVHGVSFDGQQVCFASGAVLRTIQSDRFVTGVTWVDGELWHATWEGDKSDLRRLDPQTGTVLEQLGMPPGIGVSGLECDGGNRFFCGGGDSRKLRTVRRPR